MSGLDRVRVPHDRRWIFALATVVLTVMGLMVSASWWAGAAGWRFPVALVVSVVVAAVIGLWAALRGTRRTTGRARRGH